MRYATGVLFPARVNIVCAIVLWKREKGRGGGKIPKGVGLERELRAKISEERVHLEIALEELPLENISGLVFDIVLLRLIYRAGID